VASFERAAHAALLARRNVHSRKADSAPARGVLPCISATRWSSGAWPGSCT